MPPLCETLHPHLFPNFQLHNHAQVRTPPPCVKPCRPSTAPQTASSMFHPNTHTHVHVSTMPPCTRPFSPPLLPKLHQACYFTQTHTHMLTHIHTHAHTYARTQVSTTPPCMRPYGPPSLLWWPCCVERRRTRHVPMLRVPLATSSGIQASCAAS